MKTFEISCDCEIRVIRWSTKAIGVTIRPCPLHKAAKDMLEALRECITDDESYRMTDDTIDSLKMRLAVINAVAKLAIDKARGR